MKITKTKKRLLTIIGVLCLVAFGIVTMNALLSNTAFAATQYSPAENEVYEFHPAIETFAYGLSDEILLTFKVESESPVVSVGYETYGFNVTRAPVLVNGDVNAQITLNNANRITGDRLCKS